MSIVGPSARRRMGRWEVISRIGVGGMGAVFLAHDMRQEGTGNPELAAVKVISPVFATDPEFLGRFRREVQLCRRVRGAQVAELLDADPDGDPPWLAMRFVPGQTLQAHVAEHGPLPEHELHAFARAVAEALSQIHAAGVLHRDLKPSNVILTPTTPIVIDFGVATAVDATTITRTGSLLGSPGWLSPEQVSGAPIGPSSDVFAWGLTVAYASTGINPFGNGHPEALLYRVQHQEPELEAVPQSLRALVADALAKAPAARPTVEQLLERVNTDSSTAPTVLAAPWPEKATGSEHTETDTSVLGTSPVLTPGARSVGPASPLANRRRVTTALVCALLVAALASFAISRPWNDSEAASEAGLSPQATETPKSTTQITASSSSTTPKASPTEGTPADLPSRDLLLQSRRWDLDCAGNGDPARVNLDRVEDADYTGDGVMDRIAVASCGLVSAGGWPVEVRLFNGANGFSDILLQGDQMDPPAIEVTDVGHDGTVINLAGHALNKEDCFGCATGVWQRRVDVAGGQLRFLGDRTGDVRIGGLGAAPRARPPGYGQVKIGMTPRELLATGEVRSDYSLTAGGSVCVSPTTGRAAAITFNGGMKTSRGIAVGSSATSFHDTYPEATQAPDGWWITPITEDVSYAVQVADAVTALRLQRDDQDCFT